MANALLVTALALPITVFWLLQSRYRLGPLIAAVIAVAAGWALSVAWAFAARESIAVAAALGWICPGVLVLLTWLVLRLAAKRSA